MVLFFFLFLRLKYKAPEDNKPKVTYPKILESPLCGFPLLLVPGLLVVLELLLPLLLEDVPLLGLPVFPLELLSVLGLSVFWVPGKITDGFVFLAKSFNTFNNSAWEFFTFISMYRVSFDLLVLVLLKI